MASCFRAVLYVHFKGSGLSDRGESIYPGGPRYQPKKWHRRKSVLGKDWVPPLMQDKHAGVYCPIHRSRHPYNGKNKVGRLFDKRTTGWAILWTCPTTNDVIGEMVLGQKNSSTGKLAETQKYLAELDDDEDSEHGEGPEEAFGDST